MPAWDKYRIGSNYRRNTAANAHATWPLKTNGQDIIVLVERAYERVRTRAIARKALLEMANKTWWIAAQAHSGGTGGKGRGADASLHITLHTSGDRYHLQIKVEGAFIELTGMTA